MTRTPVSIIIPAMIETSQQVTAESPRACVERFLTLQAGRDWEAALELVSDSYLERNYGAIQAVCPEETALRYGYADAEEARGAGTRQFVARMLASSTRDADGSNPSQAAIPHNADCHVSCHGEDVVVTLSTPVASTRTRYSTRERKDGTRVIVGSRVVHNGGN